VLPDLIVVVVGGASKGKGSFPGHRYLMEGLSSLIPFYGILHIVNCFLPGDSYILAVSCSYLGMFPRNSDVEQRWDEFPTKVHSARGMNSCCYVPSWPVLRTDAT
jgi:hypothetical protein